jgi:hypothetical protein
MSTTPQHATPSDWAWLEGNSTVDRCDAAWSRGLIELRARVEVLEAGVTCPHVRTSDEGSSYCALAEQHQDKLDRLIEQDRAASADARPTVKARITRDRDETGDYLIIHDTSPPASSLVERVSELRQKFEQLIKSSRAYDGYSTMTLAELADRLIDVVLEQIDHG